MAAGGRTVDGAKVRDHIAGLVPEPTNPYDPAAVRVVLAGGYSAGYLSREDARLFRPVIDRLVAVGKVTACRASLKGGWDRGVGDRGSFGVTLHIPTVDQCMKELDEDPTALTPAAAGGGL